MKDGNYKILALVFMILFFLTLFLWTIPNLKEKTEYDKYCKTQGMYAKGDTCCKIWKVTDSQRNITYSEEGCTNPINLEEVRR